MTTDLADAPAFAAPPQDQEAVDTLTALSTPDEGGCRSLEFAVPDAYCATCITSIENALTGLPQVKAARVNLSTRRVRVRFVPGAGSVLDLPRAIRASGYRTHVLDPAADGGRDPALGELVRAMAVAGFAAANIMLFSVSVWAGADAPTRNLFHWISALIALPAIAYAGRPFFRSAFASLRVGKTNMDVPITIGVGLATALSLYETVVSGEHAYFDASTMLIFFLLVGRTLDHLMQQRARGALANLARLAPRRATEIKPDGTLAQLPIDEIVPGALLLLRPGERVPVDCRIAEGSGAIDAALVTGESLPVSVAPGALLAAGSINLSSSLRAEAMRPAAQSFLAQMKTLMEAAESTRTGYRRIADRASAIYAPAVHLAALLTFIGWMLAGAGWHAALTDAVAVLIITCPCALGLAVPMVQTVAAGRLFRNGIMMRDGAALERTAAVTAVVFDKTGTLTRGEPTLAPQSSDNATMLGMAAHLAAHSTHALARALVGAAGTVEPLAGTITEYPGQGVEAIRDDGVWRLGSASFCGGDQADATDGASRVWLARNGALVGAFGFKDAIRDDAPEALQQLQADGLAVAILSGDAVPAVAAVAGQLGITSFEGRRSPADKLERLTHDAQIGNKVMMVGDGINDAPALRAAHVSMAPSSASDIGRSAADFVFTNERLASVPFTLRIARRAKRLVLENFGIAIVYNAVALPLAISGQVTPFIAAIAMSGSSFVVVANAMRLNLGHDLVHEAQRGPVAKGSLA
ncbi:MAG: heavy metal translocating P-type ATPase [Devosia sp.]|nr:heavy metal translocating P-type ATPase [Devosia sp.]